MNRMHFELIRFFFVKVLTDIFNQASASQLFIRLSDIEGI